MLTNPSLLPQAAGPCHGLLRSLMGRTAAAAPRSKRAEADEVRRMAASLATSDRRFADELYAAADRHERLD